MARPQNLQELRHGKLLTENNFPAFVDTFNYAVRRIENIVGDRDTNPQTGTIRVDNTDPEHPVIRCDRPILSGNGGAVAFGDSDLSDVGLSSVHVADLSGTPYIQLYKFDEEPNEQTGAKIDELSGTFEIGSGDWFLVKNGDELHYKKIVLSTDLSGGGGGSISVDSDIASLNSNSLQHINSSGNDYYELYGFHD